jgi:type II secretory pathway pseudopilin PulG
MRHIILLAAATSALTLSSASAQQNTNVRGVIEAFDNTVLTVRRAGGTVTKVELPEGVNVATTLPFSMSEIKPGMKLGVTTIKKPDGTIVAIDVRPISATANVGLSPHDLAPDSTMTNGVIEGVAGTSAGNELTLAINSATVKALVVPETAMSKSAPGTRADLKAGETVFVAAKADGDKLVALRVQVSKDGVKPTQ